MELLREKFIKDESLSFHNVSMLLRKKEIKDEGKSILKNLNIENMVKTEIFLSTFLIYLFPKDILEEENHKLYTLSENIIFLNREKDLRESILEFFYLFREWSGDSLKKLKDDLFQQYHSLTIEILNAEDEELKEEFKRIQNSLLKSAKLVGHDLEILNYIPVVYHSGDLEEQYDKAYFHLLEEDLKEKKFDNFKNILEFLKNFFSLFFLKDEMEKLYDIEFIEQQFMNDCFNWYPLVLETYDLLLKIQSPERDEDIKKNRIIIEEKDFLYHLGEIFQSIKNFIQDLENLKKK